jgi:hypothetical protein
VAQQAHPGATFLELARKKAREAMHRGSVLTRRFDFHRLTQTLQERAGFRFAVSQQRLGIDHISSCLDRLGRRPQEQEPLARKSYHALTRVALLASGVIV